jgi:hypothetical protein
MRTFLPIILLSIIACGHGPVARANNGIDFSKEGSSGFSRRVKVLKVLAYTDKMRNKVSTSPQAATIIKELLGEKGYRVEWVSHFRSSARKQASRGGYETTYHLDNDTMLRPHEGYLEVFVGEEMWEGDKPFTDFVEVGRVRETDYGPRMEMIKVPNLKGHKDVRRSVEAEVFLYRRGRSDCIYRRSAYVKERAFNHRKTLAMALAGIPKRR